MNPNRMNNVAPANVTGRERKCVRPVGCVASGLDVHTVLHVDFV